MQNITIATQDIQRKKESLKTVSFKVAINVVEEFTTLAKQKGFIQNAMIQKAMILAIEEMKKAEDKK
jgi:uncharacterized protein with HEPN domain